MKRFFKFIGILIGLGLMVVVVLFALLPWMDRWGATDDEIAASFSGDELVPSPRIHYTRVVSVNAAPEQVYPWIAQLGADKGGMYSYTWFESWVLQCPQTNADRIHEEWQDLKVGDKVLMCPDVNAPPAFDVALVEKNHVVVLGHQENGVWSDVWQFVLSQQDEGTTRLILRSRDAKEGWLWDVMRPGEFIMVRGMLLGIKERAEHLAETGGMPTPSNTQTVSLSEFGRNISLSHDPELASNASIGTIPSVPLSDQILFAESHPAYAQFSFRGFQNGGPYHLPILSAENRAPQVR